MRIKLLAILLTVTFIFTGVVYGQSFKKNYFKGGDGWDDRYIINLDDSRPFIELNYGFGEPKHKKFDGTFTKIGLAELKLGYVEFDYYDFDYIVKTKESFVFGSNLSTEIGSEDAEANEVETKLWRFGFGNRKGWGYDTGDFSIIPYNQSGFVWSRLEVENLKTDADLLDFPPTSVFINANDNEILNRYNEEFRFGTLAEGGVRFNFVDFVSLNVGYEASVVFPRHLFWKWAGSFIIEQAGLSAIDAFVEEIFDASPAAAPIVSFLLKNGYAYAFYQLKKDDMNWPFVTETPLTYETFKFGVTFTF